MIAQISLILFATLALATNTSTILRTSIRNKTTLNCSLSDLSTFDVIIVTFLIIFKYVLNIFGLVAKPRIEGNTLIIKEMKVSAALILTDQQISAFKDAAAGNEQMLLPAVTTPLVLLLFSKLQCPIYAIGSVNTRNQFFFSTSALKQELRAEATIGGLTSACRRVKRGMEVDVTINVYHGSDIVFTQIVTILQFMSSKAKPTPPQASTSLETTSLKDHKTAEIKLTTSQPWKWAASCKDYNPIHISAIAAKIFGFPSQIIHGNHAAALALSKSGFTSQKFDVRFLRPITIPGSVSVKYTEDVVQVVRDDKVMIEIKSL